ncbi:pyridoxal phosphate-dependent transferase [Lentinula aff. detonsa]|uniref:Pyridoxal phosphate-dependent transferase n=1 Tax=Lentinula aff. detonsa TaxID=2804958 RepID=A0AA38L4G3_9AGAR|nr:pyridoxal phosphate-dependent transferase [Lentinula aff. detonsa]
MDSATTRKAIDLSHHLNELSRSRVASPLKDIIKYMKEPGIISLAGGLPHPSLFPFGEMNTKVYAPAVDLRSSEEPSWPIELFIPKNASPSHKNTLSAALQYGSSYGSVSLSSFIREFTSRVMAPAYSDFEILLHSGNTDAWNKVVNILCEYGDYILVEECTYPSAQALWAPMGCRGVPISIDKDGLIPESLESTLKNWEHTHPGVKRPHLLYSVPVGHNPTGATLSVERKKAIYKICVDFDIIICEDDPYYFLQFPPYVLPYQRKAQNAGAGPSDITSEIMAYDRQAYIESLVPTFLSLDMQGRVIRLDTFSKTLGPGNRLGYFVCNPLFAERLLRATEVTTQAPSGLSQALVEELLTTWGQEGYLRWLMGLRDSYTSRRNWMCDIIAENFDLLPSPLNIVDDVVAVQKGHGSTKDVVPFFSFSFPKGGMFLWIRILLVSNATYQNMKTTSSSNAIATARWAEAFWMDLIEAKILLTPGSYYTPIIGFNERMAQEPDVVFFRLAFSFETREMMQTGIERMANVFNRWWS